MQTLLTSIMLFLLVNIIYYTIIYYERKKINKCKIIYLPRKE